MISTISMRAMRMPHLSVTASICDCTSVLMRSRSDRASSSERVPMTDRSAVRASASIATPKLATLNRACLASTIWVKIVALTVTTTLSRVMTSWRSPGTGISRMSTRCKPSMNGATMTRPGSWVLRYSPSRLTTPTSPCCTMLTILRKVNSRITRTNPATTSAPMVTLPKAIMSAPNTLQRLSPTGLCRRRS